MSTTPAKGRVSGIPTPGRTGIPTPGRPRSTSSTGQYPTATSPDDEFISRSFQDAIKANDPANHRTTYSNDVSLSPPSARNAVHSGRRSVTGGRPSSSASSSSAFSSSASRSTSGAKPTMPRPSSRASDVFTHSTSRPGRFEVGDNVRLESYGFEGILRYLGPIDGKQGTFAGVELHEGFAGRGKNDGSFGGKQYFKCSPNCGVFTIAEKLSPPTVLSASRPSSVASVRNGRVTPSVRVPSSISSASTGRKTPSLSNGRVTPVNGRVTPSASGRRTPATTLPTPRTRNATVTQNHITPGKPAAVPASTTPGSTGITPGSRASRYVGMTAQQLSIRKSEHDSPPSRNAIGSPTRLVSSFMDGSHLTSPTRTINSPLTPKACRRDPHSNAGTPTRMRFGTPRARLPSAVAMPPPPSPSAGRAINLNDPLGRQRGSVDLKRHTRGADSISGRRSSMDKSSRPPSSASLAGNLELQVHIDRLQARLDALEDDNSRLRTGAEGAENLAVALSNRVAALTEENEKAVASLAEERDRALVRVAELEGSVRTAERSLGERDSAMEALQRASQQSLLDIEKAKSDGEARVRDIQSKLDDKEALVAQLKELIDAKEGLQSENAAALAAKNAEIALLEARVQKAYTELEEERKELSAQVDELRKAGQETIALYEERLSTADSRRYEMEDLIASLEEQVRAQARPPSPGTVTRQASSALEIDNEALREQIQHLIRKASTLEDQLEDARMVAEREESAINDRMLRSKEREDSIRADLTERQKEVERVTKSEETARLRIEEMEEALRENKVALENARAEIENLRAEIANLEGIAAGMAGSPPKAARPAATPTPSGAFEMLKAEKAALERTCQEQEAKLAQEQEANTVLREVLEERMAELDATKKKLNREVPVNGLADSSSASSVQSSPSKHDIASAKDEIKGLKHIVNELQMENASLEQRYKVLESENKLLLSETEQLREDMKALEENIEQSLLREEQALEDDHAPKNAGSSDDIASLQKTLRETKSKYESEIEQLRKRLSELEMKNARTVHDLNKEIGELETLIEAKIYREDELETEVVRLKEKLARSQKKSSRGAADSSDRDARISSTSTIHASASASSGSIFSDADGDGDKDGVCELCDRPGHDAFSCDMLFDPRKKKESASGASASEKAIDLYCEDCEGHGHTAADCPHSLDVF